MICSPVMFKAKKKRLKNASSFKKNFSASQRIARLKRKTEQYKTISQSEGDHTPIEMNQNESDSHVTLDHMFDMVEVNDSEVIDPINGKKTNALSCVNETVNGNTSNEYRHFASSSVILVPSTPHVVQTSQGNSNSVEIMLQMQNQITDLAHEIKTLRMQVARVEMKSMQMCSCANLSRPGSSNSLIDSDMLLDFEGTLSREGLPLKTCVEINDFELKLRTDEYRTKMVRILTFILLCCCCCKTDIL